MRFVSTIVLLISAFCLTPNASACVGRYSVWRCQGDGRVHTFDLRWVEMSVKQPGGTFTTHWELHYSADLTPRPLEGTPISPKSGAAGAFVLPEKAEITLNEPMLNDHQMSVVKGTVKVLSGAQVHEYSCGLKAMQYSCGM